MSFDAGRRAAAVAQQGAHAKQSAFQDRKDSTRNARGAPPRASGNPNIPMSIVCRTSSMLLIAVVLAVAGCSTDDPSVVTSPTPEASSQTPEAQFDVADGLQGCYPGCNSYQRVTPGPLPAGTYTTEYFLAGALSLELSEGWSGIEDSTGELKFLFPGDWKYGVAFRLDDVVVGPSGAETTATRDVEGWLGFLRTDPRVITSEPAAAMIGELPATMLDVRLKRGIFVAELWHQEKFDHNDGIADFDVYRFWLADVEYGGESHILTVYIESRDDDDLQAKTDQLAPVLSSFQANPIQPRS